MKKLIRDQILLILLATLFLGCDNPIYEALVPSNDDDEIEPIQFTPSPNLPIDQNGYYHLTLSENWQTPHRVSGFIHRGDDSTNGMAYTKVAWRSNLFWILEDPNCYLKAYYGDTISYYQRRGICSDFDISDIEEYIVPSMNGSVYSREDGSIDQMIAPTLVMKGDTMMIETVWYDDWRSEERFGEPFFIILD